MLRQLATFSSLSLLLLNLPATVLAGTLTTSGFSTCLSSSNITVQKLDITYDSTAETVTFDVAGTSATTMNVTATLNVTAYGISVYSNAFNPCSADTYVEQLCPGLSSPIHEPLT
jgi:hypothetical protein